MDQHVSFTVSKDDFSSALAWVARNLPSKASQPILRGVLIDATEDGLQLSGFDREVSTKVRVSADVAEPGQVLVAGRLASNIIGALPDKPVKLDFDGTKVQVNCGSSHFELPAMTIEDYPVLPEFPQVAGTLDPDLFAQVITQVATASSRDDTLPMLTGIRMEIDGEHLVLAATDRFRLAVRTLDWAPARADISGELLIPARTLAETAKSLDAHGEPVEIALDPEGGRLLGISTAERRTTTRLIDADFPKFRSLLPKSHTSVASVEISPLLDAIRRVSLVTDGNSPVKMDFSEGNLTLSAGGSDLGEAKEQLPCAFAGEPLVIAFHPSYLKDGLGSIGTDRVVFGFNQASRSAILVPEPSELPEQSTDGTFPTPESTFTYLLMPVRLPG
ncbi:MAG TPA: DNA polymerase III subunit beta [Candidatus Corynebacterium faecigallinarum]|uniref:Beta sliding clamp n=1 Tax=Candidatus Corynebacterium faecigallinarum TaxID=2838528 RepID=A0A9D2QE22_9CORY|nr:DNA polymerase III subunit beta [Candidatus Corynebacterium faecigallinarum]